MLEVNRAKAASVVAPLFVPALDQRKIAKAATIAEAVIVDLEDAVADSRKNEARTWLFSLPAAERPSRWVRVNAVETGACRDDITAAAPHASAIVLPKCRSAEDVRVAVDALDAAKADSALIPIVETAEGLEAASDIAHSAPNRIARLSLGLGDLARDLGVSWEPGGSLAEYAGCRVAIASRAAGLAKPLNFVFPLLNDDAALAVDVARVRMIGFGGKFCIHPKQLSTVIAGFRPTRDELDLERKKVLAFADAIDRGSAAIVVDGYFVDYPVAELAEARLASVGEATGRLRARAYRPTPQGRSRTS